MYGLGLKRTQAAKQIESSLGKHMTSFPAITPLRGSEEANVNETRDNGRSAIMGAWVIGYDVAVVMLGGWCMGLDGCWGHLGARRAPPHETPVYTVERFYSIITEPVMRQSVVQVYPPRQRTASKPKKNN